MDNSTLPAGTEEAISRAVHVLSYALQEAERLFFSLPGSTVVARYVKSSHQNDPGRTFLELGLAIMLVFVVFQRRRDGKRVIKFSEKVCTLWLRVYVADKR